MTTNTNEKPRWERGCYVGGQHGIYGMLRVVELAQSAGFNITELDEAVIAAYKVGEETLQVRSWDGTNTEPLWVFDALEWLSEGAEDWLNDNVAYGDEMFGWYDGEFYLWSAEEWENA